MKRRDLERKLRDLGFTQEHGAKHDKWTNGVHTDMVPRHDEINEHTAKAILRRCQEAAKRKAEAGN